MSDGEKRATEPGVCIPWEEKAQEYDHVEDPESVRAAWEELDQLAYKYVWYWLIA